MNTVKSKNLGFTLIELLLVFGTIVFLAILTLPVGLNFVKIQSLDGAGSGILSNLRRAQSKAVFQKNDSDFGVKFLADSYVLFQGSSYVSRVQSEDEVFTLPGGVITSGMDEIIFSKLIGTPSVTGALIISLGGGTQSLNVNILGKIEKN